MMDQSNNVYNRDIHFLLYHIQHRGQIQYLRNPYLLLQFHMALL